MKHDRKETLSPTLVQSLTQTKSPLTAFGEGLMKVGETNQKIHDTIWEHDLREERRERERFKFEMEKELHDIELRRKIFQQEQDEKYNSAEREAGIANARANTWNTSENARMTQQNRKFALDDRKIEETIRRFWAENYFNGEGLTVEGQLYLDNLEIQSRNETLSQEQREQYYHDLQYSKNAIGKEIKVMFANQQKPSFSDINKQALYDLGINPDVYSYKNGAIVASNDMARASLNLLPLYDKYSGTMYSISSGEKTLKQAFKENPEFEKDYNHHVGMFREFWSMQQKKYYLEKRGRLDQTSTFLEKLVGDEKIKEVKNAVGVIDGAVTRIKSRIGGLKDSQIAFNAFQKIYIAGKTKDYYGGNASENDRKQFELAIGGLGHDDLFVLKALLTMIEGDLAIVRADIGDAHHVLASAKYGESYDKLKYLHNELSLLIKVGETKLHGGTSSSAYPTNTAYGQGDTQYSINNQSGE